MNYQVAVLIAYSILLVRFGLLISRRVKKADDFLVAGRTLGSGLLATTFLAANIGAGSTVGATGLGYIYGFGAWWWVRSEEHTSELQSLRHLVCRLLLEKKNKHYISL